MQTKMTGILIGMMVMGLAAVGHAQEWDWWQSFQEETQQEDRVRAPEPTIIDLREAEAESRDQREAPAEAPSADIPFVQQRVIEIQKPNSILPGTNVADPVDSEISLPYDELGGMYILYTDSDDQAAFDEMVLGSIVFQADAATHMAEDPKVEAAVQAAGSVGELVNAVYPSDFDMLVAESMVEVMLLEKAMQEAAIKQLLKDPKQFQEILKPNAAQFKKILGGIIDALKKKTQKQNDAKKDPEWDGVGASGTPGGSLPWGDKKSEDNSVAGKAFNAPSCVFQASSPTSAGGFGVPKGGGFAGTSIDPDGSGAFGMGKSGQVEKQLGKNIPKDACPQMGKQGQIGKGTPVQIDNPSVPDVWGRHNSLADFVIMVARKDLGVTKLSLGMLTGSPERKMNELLKFPGNSDPKAVTDVARAALQQMGKLQGSPYPTVGSALAANGIKPGASKPPAATQPNQGEGKNNLGKPSQPAQQGQDKPAEQKPSTPQPKQTNPNPQDDGVNELKANACDQHKMQIANCFDQLTAGQTEKSLAEKSLLCQKLTVWAEPATVGNPCADGKSDASGFDFYEFMYGNSQGAGAGAGDGPDDK